MSSDRIDRAVRTQRARLIHVDFHAVIDRRDASHESLHPEVLVSQDFQVVQRTRDHR